MGWRRRQRDPRTGFVLGLPSLSWAANDLRTTSRLVVRTPAMAQDSGVELPLAFPRITTAVNLLPQSSDSSRMKSRTRRKDRRKPRYGLPMLTRWLVILVGIMFFPRRPSNSSAKPATPRRSVAGSKKGRSAFPYGSLAGVVSFTLIVGAAGLFVTDRYQDALPTISEAPPNGSIYLYFDRPGIEATMEVTAISSDRHDLSDSYDVRIRVDGIENVDAPGFSVVLAGSAMPDETYPDGSDRPPQANDCPPTVLGIQDDIQCVRTKGSPESLFAAEEAKEDLVVVSGVIERFEGANDSGQAWLQILAPASTISKSRERRIFQLPTIGTSNFPTHEREELTALVDDVDGLYVPGITVVVDYDRLSPTDSLEGVSVEPVSRQPLTWVETFQSAITVSGTIVDGREERITDRSVFAWGVLAGIVGGLVVPVFGAWYSLARTIRKRRSE